MANEQYKLPVVLVFAAPARHSGETDAVPDDVEKLSVREFLGIPRPHIRRGRIHIPAHLRFPAAIVGVADGAMIGEVIAAFGDIEGSRAEWIFHVPGRGRRRQVARVPGKEGLENTGVISRAEATVLQGPAKPNRYADKQREANE